MDAAVKVKDRWHQLADAIQASDLPPSDRAVYWHLLRKANFVTAELPEKFTPTVVEIAKATKWSLRQVKYSIGHLSKHRWLEVTGRASRGHKRQYVLAIGAACDCTGRRHESVQPRERVQPEPRKGAPPAPFMAGKGAPRAPQRVQPKGATPQVNDPFSHQVKRGASERRKKAGVLLNNSDLSDFDLPDETTALACGLCGNELDLVNAEQGTHPGCDPGDGGGIAEAERVIADVFGAKESVSTGPRPSLYDMGDYDPWRS